MTVPEHHPQDRSEQVNDASLEDQVDRLLNDVDDLTDEVLAEPDRPDDNAGHSAREAGPTQPVDQQPADDDGLAETSPLIQDGHKKPADEIVAEVDGELDQMERLIHDLGEARPSTAPAAAPRSPERTTPQEMAESRTPVDAPRLDHDIADDIPAEPTPVDYSPTPQERQLDDDLDQLLAGADAPDQAGPVDEGRAVEASVREDSPPVEGADEHEGTNVALPERLLASVSIWQLIKIKAKAKAAAATSTTASALASGLAGLLDRFDAVLGSRLSPMVKELVGYCALGTLAMCLIAILLSLI